MKNKVYFIVITVVCLILLAACGTDPATTSEDGDSSKNRIQTTIIGGRTGGAWSIFSEGIAESLRRTYPE